MAHVTVDDGYPKVNVNGSFREWYYSFDIAADADYLDVPMRTVDNVTFINDTDTNDIGVAGISIVGRKSRIVFDTPGAVTNVLCRVTGH